MRISKGAKINQLLQNWPKGIVATSTWLQDQGISMSLKQKYEANHWLESIGYGAVIRTGDQVGWQGAVCALQTQLKLNIHVGGKSALELQGYAHFIKFGATTIHLYSQEKGKLPLWFLSRDWGALTHIHGTRFLKTNEGMTSYQVGDFSIEISGPERAFLEMLYLVPQHQDLNECYYLLENMIDLRPSILQKLLTKVDSIKVKRLFFFLADKLNHPWLDRLDKSKISLGAGKRHIIKDGALDKKYLITVPKDLLDGSGERS